MYLKSFRTNKNNKIMLLITFTEPIYSFTVINVPSILLVWLYKNYNIIRNYNKRQLLTTNTLIHIIYYLYNCKKVLDETSLNVVREREINPKTFNNNKTILFHSKFVRVQNSWIIHLQNI